MTNETPQPNENKRFRMSVELLNVAELFDAVTAPRSYRLVGGSSMFKHRLLGLLKHRHSFA
jgi:hypothetical protein